METTRMEKFDTRFEQLYVSWFAKMKRFACEYVISEEDSENIVHDIFMELWAQKEMFPIPVNMVAFLFTSVRNKCIDHLRRRTIEQQAAVYLQEEYVFTLQMNLNSLEILDENLLANSDIDKVVSDAIATLPDKCREIFIKSRIEGKKQKEIAKELNISINTVESQMGIAYRKLKDELKDFFPLFIFMLYLMQGKIH